MDHDYSLLRPFDEEAAKRGGADNYKEQRLMCVKVEIKKEIK